MPALFDRNWARLEARDPRFAEVLRNARPDRRDAGVEVEVGKGPRGFPVVRVGGVQLASAYDPASEARRLAAPLLEKKPDLVVALGVALGHAIEALRAERPIPVLIYEPSLARLCVALEHCDFPWLKERTLYWADTPENLAQSFRGLYTAGLRVEVLTHPVAKRLDPERVATALTALSTAKRTADIADRTRVLKSADFAAQSVDNLGALLRTPPITRLRGLFEGIPAVVAAAGPSLDRQLETLGELGSRALVIAIGQSLPALRRAGIRPDLTHVVESQDVSHQLSDGGPSQEVDLVTIPSAHSALFSTPVASRFVAYPSPNGVGRWIAARYGEDEWILGAPTVAQSAVHLAAALGANPILLIGQDLAFSEGRVYASGSAYRMVSFRDVGDGRFVYTGEDEKARLLCQAPRGGESAASEIVWVPGWDGERVPTSPQYASFIDHYREVAALHKKAGIRLVNCTEGGARIPGLEHGAFAETLRAALRGKAPREKIRERYHGFDTWEVGPLETGLMEARRSLDRLGAARLRAQRRLPRLRAELRTHSHPSQQLSALRRLGAVERRLARALEAIPWLDMMGQASVHRSALELHRTQALAPADAALAEAEALLETTREAAARSRELLERIGAQLSGLAQSSDRDASTALEPSAVTESTESTGCVA